MAVCSLSSATAVNITLTYFNAKGRAEVSRLILAYAGAQYNDDRISYEEFGTLQSKLRYKQLPKLLYDGEILYQSLTIARFLADEFGLSGRTSIESAQASEVVDRVADLVSARFKIIYGPESERNAGFNRLFSDQIPEAMGQLEKLLGERGGQYLVGNHLSLADLYIFAYYDLVGKEDVLDNFPLLKNLTQRIAALPNIKNYLATRPATED